MAVSIATVATIAVNARNPARRRRSAAMSMPDRDGERRDGEGDRDREARGVGYAERPQCGDRPADERDAEHGDDVGGTRARAARAPGGARGLGLRRELLRPRLVLERRRERVPRGRPRPDRPSTRRARRATPRAGRATRRSASASAPSAGTGGSVVGYGAADVAAGAVAVLAAPAVKPTVATVAVGRGIRRSVGPAAPARPARAAAVCGPAGAARQPDDERDDRADDDERPQHAQRPGEVEAEDRVADRHVGPPAPAEPSALHERDDADHAHDGDADDRRVDDAAGEALELDLAVGVGQQQPRDRVEQHERCAEHRDHDDDAAHDDRVDAETSADAGAHAAEPPGPTRHPEAAQPGVEPGARGIRCRTGGVRRSRTDRPLGLRAGGRGVPLRIFRHWACPGGGLVRLHASMLAVAARSPPWGESLIRP